MRKNLGELEGERKRFTGRFVRLGKRVNFKGHSEETILLTNICDARTGKQLTDHLWFAFTLAFQKVKLEEGCLLEFSGRVKSYSKGYQNRRYRIDKTCTDFKLSHPTAVKRIDKGLL